ncbi:hypothetical protein BJ508DRAFT_308812 [Ascobolus immersus RN42]|uniref:Uncharacterized protein n=1 Tax=Ascobolus immersus RN42 TaxID=1160509 RepID=A0A3N4HYG8_ASCIM|nr:hypothetical protein BJ508DRAFT_308812 [Ascobolus immersus RN42]
MSDRNKNASDKEERLERRNILDSQVLPMIVNEALPSARDTIAMTHESLLHLAAYGVPHSVVVVGCRINAVEGFTQKLGLRDGSFYAMLIDVPKELEKLVEAADQRRWFVVAGELLPCTGRRPPVLRFISAKLVPEVFVNDKPKILPAPWLENEELCSFCGGEHDEMECEEEETRVDTLICETCSEVGHTFHECPYNITPAGLRAATRFSPLTPDTWFDLGGLAESECDRLLRINFT